MPRALSRSGRFIVNTTRPGSVISTMISLTGLTYNSPGMGYVPHHTGAVSMAMDRRRLAELFDLTGRTAVITGGTRGSVGAGRGIRRRGANVVVASRKPEACEEAQRHLVELGGAALGVPTHLGELPALRDLVDRSVEAFGGIDILVNNAANPSLSRSVR